MNENTCPCGLGSSFFSCCEPFILGQRAAGTPEQLMRSRYSAYATNAVEYIFESTHPSTRKFYSKKSIAEWASSSKWLKLEVIESTETTVRFKAYYIDESGKIQVHSELSTFGKVNDRWYFIEGSEG